MSKEFRQATWDAAMEEELSRLLQAAVREDLDRFYDWTTVALVPEGAQGRAAVVTRQAGVVAGLKAARRILAEYDGRLEWQPAVDDGSPVAAGTVLGEVSGPARSLLTAERVLLNFVGRLSGIATLTARFVERLADRRARLYDTRKTTPGWRLLEKYAVRCGGGHNHRLGLHEAVLIKDNHLAFGQASDAAARYTPREAVVRARAFLKEMLPAPVYDLFIVEVEVDSLAQLDDVLVAGPDIVLLDNFALPELRQAVARRNANYPAVQLEASGGVRLETVAEIAATGVDRISSGALTHGAVWLDIALDWR